MDQGEVKYLEAPKTQTPKLSELIRTHGYTNGASWQFCALGTAYQALTGSNLYMDYIRAPIKCLSAWEFAAKVFNIPAFVARKVSSMAYAKYSSNEIADYVASEGY